MTGEIAALITAMLWTVSSISFSEASIRIGPVYINVTRIIFALLFLGTTLIVIQAPIKLSFYQIYNLAISGFIGLVFGDTFLLRSYKLIGPRLSSLVMSSVPPISASLAFIFLGEKISFFGITGIFVTSLGIALVLFQREEKPTSKYKIDMSGVFYAFLGAVGQAVGLIFAKFAFNESPINGFVATFIRVFSALIILYPFAILTKRYVNPVKSLTKDKKTLLFIIIGSIFGPFLGITFSLIAVSNAKVGIASTIMATVPILILPAVKFYYKEKLSWISILGAFIAVGGVAIIFLT